MSLFTYTPRCNTTHTIKTMPIIKITPQYTYADGYVRTVDWSQWETWLLPARNAFCLNDLAKSILNRSNKFGRISDIIKVEIFDFDTHELIAMVER